MLKGILRLVVVGWIVSMVAGAVAAMQAKRRIGPNTLESADDIAASAIFGPLDYHSTATNLRGGTLELWYGGGVLDLRDAKLAPEGATLNVKVVFGGGQVLVPADWKVVANVSGLGANARASSHRTTGSARPCASRPPGNVYSMRSSYRLCPSSMGSTRWVCRQTLNGPRTCSSQNCRSRT